jgi:hypothetical protein
LRLKSIKILSKIPGVSRIVVFIIKIY